MRFNKFLWNNYCQTDRGRSALQRYANISKESVENDLWMIQVVIRDEFRDLYDEPAFDCDIVDIVRAAAGNIPIKSPGEADESYIEFYKNYIPVRLPDKSGKIEDAFYFGEAEEDWYDYVAAISLELHLAQVEVDLENERDVEIQLIEPLLARLGYQDKDWIRQMPIRMGRGERNYPDYAIGATLGRGKESAHMIIESKYQLSSRRNFEEAFLQAKSYAVRLQCEAMTLAAREGIWIFQKSGDAFEIEHHAHHSWGELNHPDAFHEALSKIGRKTILRKPNSI